jgi:hypothetical protein
MRRWTLETPTPPSKKLHFVGEIERKVEIHEFKECQPVSHEPQDIRPNIAIPESHTTQCSKEITKALPWWVNPN